MEFNSQDNKLIAYHNIVNDIDVMIAEAERKELDRHIIEALDQARSEAERVKRSLIRPKQRSVIKNPSYDDLKDMFAQEESSDV